MLEVKSPGIYVFLSVHDTYSTAHLRPRIDYSHLVKHVIDGPFQDVVMPDDGRIVMSAHKVAIQRLTEVLAGSVNPQPTDRTKDLQEITDGLSGDQKKINELLKRGQS